MKTRRLGRSPIHVSEICMGTMTFGNQADEAMSHRILDKSFEAGITFYDTAENYPVPPDAKYAGRKYVKGDFIDIDSKERRYINEFAT